MTILRRLDLIASGAEALGVSRVLNTAAWTSVAAFITSPACFVWHRPSLLQGRSHE